MVLIAARANYMYGGCQPKTEMDDKGQPVCVDATEDEWSHVQTGWMRSRFLVEPP